MDHGSDRFLGQLIGGRYRVHAKLIRGGMGWIYRATQEPLGREVALKVLRREYLDDTTAVRRFEKEAMAISRLNHPHIVTIYDFGRTEDGELFIAMEYLNGRSLREVLDDDGKLPHDRALKIIEGIVSGLVEAHRLGIMHRDLKPENVMLLEQYDRDFVKILDFGLARSIEESQQLTQQDMIPGTPNYIPPERVNGLADDLRSDLYSLGAMWFELVCGEIPFDGSTSIKIIVKHLQEPPPRPTERGASMPAAAEELILRLLAKRPEERPDSAEQLLTLLHELSSAGWVVRSATQVASRATHVPDLSLFGEEDLEIPDLNFASALGLDELEKELSEEVPIALTKKKNTATRSLVPVDTSMDAVVRLTKVKSTTEPDRAPIQSIAEAAGALGMSRSVEDVARNMVRFLSSRFDSVAVVDRRETGIRVIDAAGLDNFDDAALLFGEAGMLWDLVERGEAYYGPPLRTPEWTRFYVGVVRRVPGGMLLAALKRDGQPALLVYADHESETLRDDLKDAATLLREAAAALTVLSF
jgi:serine/threonine protein kinase